MARKKWPDDTESIKKGDVVVIVDPQIPGNCWLKGVVDDVYPGEDGRVRVAKVRTIRGQFIRPCTRLARLTTPLSKEYGAGVPYWGGGGIASTKLNLDRDGAIMNRR